MVIYIYLILHQIVVSCNAAGCLSASMGHFDYLISIAALELIFELPGIIKIFKKKDKTQK